MADPKSPNSRKRAAHISWDEQNLEENERIKKELNVVKINEPKTPYRGPQQAEADEFDAPPVSGGFALDGEASSSGLSTGRSTSDISMSPPRSPHGEQAASGGLGLGPMVAEDHSIPTTSWGSDLAHAQHTPGAAAGGADEDMAESDGQPQPQRQQEASVVPRCSFDSSGEEGETQEARHRRFETMRKAHYNMRELLKARPPSDDEEGEEEGNDGGGTSSAGARGGAAG